MISCSDNFDVAMHKTIRDRAYMSVAIGIVNQKAQSSATVDSSNLIYYSSLSAFSNSQTIDYATLESDYFVADGKMFFPPENDELLQIKNNGIVTNGLLDPVRINFADYQSIRGITIDFGNAYPTQFTLQTASNTFVFENNNRKFATSEELGDTDFIMITPHSMLNGDKRTRIKNVLFGNGLEYSNEQIKSINTDDYVSAISNELSAYQLNIDFYDENQLFDVSSKDNVLDYLQTMQEVTVMYGQELEDGSVEQVKLSTSYLSEWKVKDGVVSITATDKLSHLDGEYSTGNRIYDRTAYEEAYSILTDAGLSESEFEISDYWKSIYLYNPMPVTSHKEALQILANACRSVVTFDTNGKIITKTNFANILNADDLTVTANNESAWSNVENVLNGTMYVYADFTKDFLKSDGSMYFLPEDNNFLATSYVSEYVSDENGLFAINPIVEIKINTPISFYSASMVFDGNPAREIIVRAYSGSDLSVELMYENESNVINVDYDFINVDRLVFEFVKTAPYNRILVNNISYYDLSDYTLEKNAMTKNPVGYKDKKIKSVRCKVNTYNVDDNNEPVLVEDAVYYNYSVSDVGEVKTINNPLVSNMSQAMLLAEWVANYYANNISYEIEHRGDPRLQAADIINTEIQSGTYPFEIEKNIFSFNGAISGSIELRRALRMVGVKYARMD